MIGITIYRLVICLGIAIFTSELLLSIFNNTTPSPVVSFIALGYGVFSLGVRLFFSLIIQAHIENNRK
jgi:hypothetical protein